jgi:ferredoxin--NADP+ reductase
MPANTGKAYPKTTLISLGGLHGFLLIGFISERILIMYRIVGKKELAQKIKLLEIHAPEIAAKAQAGQFVILRIDHRGERIPLTLMDWDTQKGTITLVFLEVGASTEKLGALAVGDVVLNIAGPLGKPSEVKRYGLICILGGGVGTASAFPVARALKREGNKVIAVIGAKTAELLILKDVMAEVADELFTSTDDGTEGQKGFVSDVLRTLIQKGYQFDVVYAIGPTLMMRAVAETTRPHNIRTVVSLNPIMVDGMGMCGACRVSVGGKTKFACVDGPEFDAHQVDFGELLKRQMAFLSEEKLALQRFQRECGHHE